jgi:hypothetical protein
MNADLEKNNGNYNKLNGCINRQRLEAAQMTFMRSLYGVTETD